MTPAGRHSGAPRATAASRSFRGSSFCAIDSDGLAPLSSGCNGDSGGPLYAGPASAPVLLGVVSYGGSRCGADHLPSVFAEVGRLRLFITDPDPVWAPLSTAPGRITGARRPGSRLACVIPDVPRGARAEIEWKRFSGHGVSADREPPGGDRGPQGRPRGTLPLPRAACGRGRLHEGSRRPRDVREDPPLTLPTRGSVDRRGRVRDPDRSPEQQRPDRRPRRLRARLRSRIVALPLW